MFTRKHVIHVKIIGNVMFLIQMFHVIMSQAKKQKMSIKGVRGFWSKSMKSDFKTVIGGNFDKCIKNIGLEVTN